jgi:hypothetical protein
VLLNEFVKLGRNETLKEGPPSDAALADGRALADVVGSMQAWHAEVIATHCGARLGYVPWEFGRALLNSDNGWLRRTGLSTLCLWDELSEESCHAAASAFMGLWKPGEEPPLNLVHILQVNWLIMGGQRGPEWKQQRLKGEQA